MKKRMNKINYVKELKERLVDVDFSKKPKKDISFEELKELARKARKAREKYERKSSIQPEVGF